MTQKSSIAFLGLLIPAVLPAQDLPEKTDASGNGLDFEPQILLIEPAPGEGTQPETSSPEYKDTDVEAAREKYERAARKAERWQKLGKNGVLSKVEIEGAILRAAKAEAQYHAVRLWVAKAAADKNLAGIEEEERAARSRLREVELIFARNMVDRLRKLRAMRIGSVSQLQRAESALKQLESLPKP